MRFVAKWYTRASRVRIVVAKFDGRWNLPGGPYPIPELIAGVGGILATLYALPHLGHPLYTAVVGFAMTAVLVAVMRRMPYSPVKFSTRVHRVARLYGDPISVSGAGIDTSPRSPVSVVRQAVTILDHSTAPTTSPQRSRVKAHSDQHASGLFDYAAPAGAPAELFR